MIKTHTVLPKKLQELQSQLNEFESLSPESPYHRIFSQDIEHRFLFLKNLLSAEIASHSGNNIPHHLQHMAQRLSELETTFRQWTDFRRPAEELLDENVEKVSTCSCTESCPNDGGGGDVAQMADEYFEEKEKVPWAALENEEKRSWAWAGKHVRILLGAILMGSVMVTIFGCLLFYEEETIYLVPT